MEPTRNVRLALGALGVLLFASLLGSCGPEGGKTEAPAVQGGESRSAAPTIAGAEAPPGAAAPPAQLVLKHRDAGAWTDCMNSFAVAGCDTTKPQRRSGLLFQFGNYAGTTYRYKDIRLYGARVDTTLQGFVWVNVVSKFDGRPERPIDPPEAAFGLFPNNGNALRPQRCSSGPVAEPDGRVLNSRLTVKALLTYWQGPSGWSVIARQDSSVCAGNSFRFSFPDSFRVEVYSPKNPQNGTSMGTPRVFAIGEVDSIVVGVEISPDEDLGKIQDPPWLYP